MSLRLLDVVLTGLNVDRGLRDAIIGDLLEERTALAAARGTRFADRWMLSQILRSLPALAQATLRAGGTRAMASIFGAALAALLAVLIVASASAAVVFNTISAQTMARFAIVALAVDLAYGVAGGYLAARLGGVAPLASAVACGSLGVMLSLVATGQAMPGWYPLALQLLLVPATAVGGWMRARQLVVRP
ncbi:MAG TPA: hypothetical protein VLE53_12075 [Gemmatimonadaceae bacterium]|nr:hypothetical protein [Gemmatimonadaceae bacterium]